MNSPATSVPESRYVAANRFGLGLAPGELASITDPRQWLKRQLAPQPPLPAPLRPLQHSSHYLAQSMAQRQMARRDRANNAMMLRARRDAYEAQQGMRLAAAIETSSPFVERLVHFWSNHFTVSLRSNARPLLLDSVLAFENECIRTHVCGRFKDMLLAVEQHPVMLLYLDNVQSTGPDSLVGRRRDRGLNENLAREILELHTLGVRAGYSQADVQGLARALTGWSVASGRNRARGDPGTFAFVAPMHQPGGQRVLGTHYPAPGVEQGEAILRDLALHPATARFIAGKLARHFLGDQPPADAVSALERTFIESNGDLQALYHRLIEWPDAFDPAPKKFKTPYELLVSSLRAVNQRSPASSMNMKTLQLFDQMPFSAPSPAGWSDLRESWATPAALVTRTQWAMNFASRVASRIDPEQMLAQVLPANEANRPLMDAVTRAESAASAVGLLLASPQFQWR